MKVWATGIERRDSGARNHSVDVARHPLSTTHTRTRLFKLAFSWEAWNIVRGLEEAVRKSTPLEDLRHYLCLDGGLIQLDGLIWHIWEPRKEAYSERIVLITGSACCRVLAVQGEQEMVSELQKTLNSIEQSGECILKRVRLINRVQAKICRNSSWDDWDRRQVTRVTLRLTSLPHHFMYFLHISASCLSIDLKFGCTPSLALSTQWTAILGHGEPFGFCWFLCYDLLHAWFNLLIFWRLLITIVDVPHPLRTKSPSESHYILTYSLYCLHQLWPFSNDWYLLDL